MDLYLCFANSHGAKRISTSHMNESPSWRSGILNSVGAKASDVLSTKKTLHRAKNNFLSQLTFTWVNDVMKLGKRNKTLEMQDVWQLDEPDLMQSCSENFIKFLERENNQSLPVKPEKRTNKNILQLYWQSAITRALTKM